MQGFTKSLFLIAIAGFSSLSFAETTVQTIPAASPSTTVVTTPAPTVNIVTTPAGTAASTTSAPTTTVVTTPAAPAAATAVATPNPVPSVADTEITDKAKSAIAGSNLLKGATIVISTQNGVVNLSGTTYTQSQADEAYEIAKSIYGVKEVRSNIVVTPPPTTVTPTVVTVPQVPATTTAP